MSARHRVSDRLLAEICVILGCALVHLGLGLAAFGAVWLWSMRRRL